MQTLTPNVKLSIAIAQGSRGAGQTNINGAAVSMNGFEGIRAIVELGAITAGAVTSIKLQESDSSTSGFTDIDGTEITVADDDDDEIKIVEAANVRKHYARVVVDRGTQNAALRTALYEQFNPAFAPVTQGSDVEYLVATPA